MKQKLNEVLKPFIWGGGKISTLARLAWNDHVAE